MGQSYDSNSIYAKWSPYFDYSSLKTLEASKKLPVPKGIEIEETEDGVDITDEIETLVQNSIYDDSTNRLVSEDLPEDQKLAYLAALRQILLKVEKHGGTYSYRGKTNPLPKKTLDRVKSTIIGHEKYKIPAGIAEAAYKNVASSNIYLVSHDIRNRDQAYTAIAMGLMRNAADKSPKGEQASTLNMLNPLTKYIMQYQNLVGKDVIGITANGEKYWFNLYYYWTQALKSGDEEAIKWLQFSTTLTRIKGRGTKKDAKGNPIMEMNTVNHIPDLNARDIEIKNALLNEFGATPDTMEYKYVDQVISQLLSAATDNAKELILAKINAGTNFAKMYIYLITMGYNIDDIAAFMTSPIGEFIDGFAQTNMFQSNSTSPAAAINASLGKVTSKYYLHGTISEYDEESQEMTVVSKTAALTSALGNFISEHPNLEAAMLKAMDIEGDSFPRNNLDTMMQGLIRVAADSPRIIDNMKDLNLLEIDRLQSRDVEINNYIRFCQDLIIRLRTVVKRHPEGMEGLLLDAKEFQKVYNLANEMSSIASGYLGLNQGLPTDELGILKKLNQMRKPITERERVLGIYGNQLYNKDEAVATAAWEAVIANIQDNNPFLDEATIRQTLKDAYDADIMNNFDAAKMLIDDKYKQIAKEYLHVIKGTANVIDMMDKIPHYSKLMDCMKALVVANNTLSSKSRLINKLTADYTSVSDDQLQGIVRYADRLNAVDFCKDLPIIALHKSSEGFSPFYDDIRTNQFDLATMEGISGFRHFMQTEFLDFIQEQYPKNPLVKHLKNITSGGQNILSTDIDLLNPNVTSDSRIAYDEILRGMAQFELTKYNDDYTIADLLQLYNIIVNSNQYGGERLTTAFKACSSPKGILQKYLNSLAVKDSAYGDEQEFNQTDFKINAAPIVSPYAERFHSEPYIKVKDPVWDYVLKKYHPETNSYTEEPLLPIQNGEAEDKDVINARRVNYAENCPFEMPNYIKLNTMIKTLSSTETTPEALKALQDILLNLSVSGKISIVKDC